MYRSLTMPGVYLVCISITQPDTSKYEVYEKGYRHVRPLACTPTYIARHISKLCRGSFVSWTSISFVSNIKSYK